MSILRIHLFGTMRIDCDNHIQPADFKITHTTQTLLAYLLVQRNRSHSREMLAGLFWGDYPQERARNCLNTAVWRLRAALEPCDILRGTYLVITPLEVCFNCESDYWLDVAVFEEQAEKIRGRPVQSLTASDADELERALHLYAGDLLEGFYDDWAIRERERLRGLYLDGLTRLMCYYKSHGAYEKSLVFGQLILAHDPLREEVHREMMRLHLENGQRTMAARQYEICRESLLKELGIQPMEETQALYAQIVRNAHWQDKALAGPEDSIPFQLASKELDSAVSDLESSLRQFQHVVRLLGHLIQARDH